MPKHDAMEVRFQLLGRYIRKHISHIHNGMTCSGCEKFPVFGYRRIHLEPPVGIEEYNDTADVGMSKVPNPCICRQTRQNCIGYRM